VGLPPLRDRRRLFAGGRLRVVAGVRVGAPVSRRSLVTDVRVVEGRTGALLFVTVRHTFSGADGADAVVEDQDLAYRAGSARPVGTAGTERTADLPEPDVSLTPDAVTLFRFSALTGNSHRIHYDERYATGTEGLPGRLVHGPLLALLLLEPDRRAGRRVTGFSYRLLRPVPLGAVLDVRRTSREGGARLVLTADGVESAAGEVETEDGS
jgi:3-methylfumaryl-CoA hydratase